MRIALALVAVSSTTLTARPAEACSPFTNMPFVVTPGEDGDTRPPTAVTVEGTSFRRIGESEDCTFEGILAMNLSASDSSGNAVGFSVEAITGTFEPPLDGAPVRPGDVRSLVFYIPDLEPRYDLEIRAVDHAGNEGPARRMAFAVENTDDGCAAGGAPSPLVALALVGLVCRRRR